MADPGAALARLDEQYDHAKYIVLQPQTITEEGAFSPLLYRAVSQVRINTAREAGEIYHEPRYAAENFREPDKSKCALTALGLNKIAQAAGMRWIPELTGVLARERRPNGHIYIRYRAVGAIRQPNGEWYGEPAEKEIDTEDVAERMTAQDWRQWEKWGGKKATDQTPWWIKPLVDADREKVARIIAERTDQQIMQLKEFLLGHAQTKAKNIVIRRVFGLPQVFLVKELRAKTLIVPQLIHRPDVTDPLQLERVQLEGRRAADDLYGGGPPRSSSAVEVAEVRSLPDHSSVVESPEPSEGEDGSGGGAEVADLGAKRGKASQAATSAPVEDDGPRPPKEDPIFEEGPHKGERMSRVAEIDPQFLRGLLSGTRAKKRQELIQGWLDWSQPPLGS